MSHEEIEILPWRDEFAPEYARLNRSWLEMHDLLEPDDLPYLYEPRERILDPGGAILCAVRDGEVVGTVAVLRLDAGTCELAKLAVAPAAQGRGLGRRLSRAALELAAALGARRVVLSSSSRLAAALGLYRSLGFRPSPPPAGAVAYRTADVHLALELGP